MSERCEYIRTSGTTHWCALAAEPRQWVGLTDDEANELVHRYARYELLNAIEAKLKEKNT